MSLIYISLFGILGVLLRYQINFLTISKNIPPTIIANILGCLIIGVCYYYQIIKPEIKITKYIMTGLCGALTTYSSFNLEIFKFIEQQKIIEFLIYIGLTFIFCLIATSLGYFGAKFFFQS
ncbi:MAG: CrcB family protein [Bacteriovoracaceae bacterium]|jgi:CrcB protein|nr:CrcB family protein [Bacteriovoracaceae bacterium]